MTNNDKQLYPIPTTAKMITADECLHNGNNNTGSRKLRTAMMKSTRRTTTTSTTSMLIWFLGFLCFFTTTMRTTTSFQLRTMSTISTTTPTTRSGMWQRHTCSSLPNPQMQQQQQIQQQLYRVHNQQQHPRTSSSSTTSLNIWWYGGSEAVDEKTMTTRRGDQHVEESCELVAVRIERPTMNSRKIFGEIIVPTPIDDVWAILTDYDRLSVHVPNLVDSKVVPQSSQKQSSSLSSSSTTTAAGDGQYSCRLFQRGSQKIVGFDFSASVTMDMQESIIRGRNALPTSPVGTTTTTTAAAENDDNNDLIVGGTIGIGSDVAERRISFKCADSFFFSEFDGDWHAKERRIEQGGGTGSITNAAGLPLVETVLSYTVYVRPKGPVPVAALEWRIREDVPTNLRAVKRAAMLTGYRGVMKYRNQILAGQERLQRQRLMPQQQQQQQQKALTRRQQQQQPVLATAATANSRVNRRRRIDEVAAVTTATRNNKPITTTTTQATSSDSDSETNSNSNDGRRRAAIFQRGMKVQWYVDETMATYLPRGGDPSTSSQ